MRRDVWGLARPALVLAVGLAAAGLGRSAGAEELKGREVKFPGGAGEIRGYLAQPEGKGPFPAVVVIHEWWGLADWVKQNADRLAGQGYVALAVDLYGGKVTADPGEAHELMRALDDQEGLADLRGGVAYLQSLEVVAKDKPIGAIGWCMGGKFSRLLAQASDAIGPAVICYGSVATDPAQVAQLKGKPVLGIFGSADRGIPVDKVRQFAESANSAGAKVELKVYEGAGHGFMRPGHGQHDAKAADDAWKQVEAFFAENLKS